MQILVLTQGIYYLVTGLWPLFHIKSFEKLTGPKMDKWLVKMVGLLAADIGLIILLAKGESYIPTLAVLSAASFAGIDAYYSLKGRISKIYLGDAVLQAIFILGWLTAMYL